MNSFKQQLKDSVDYRLILTPIIKHYGVYFDENQVWWLWDESQKKWKIVDDVDILNMIDAAVDFDKSSLQQSVKNIMIELFRREGRKNKPEELKKTQIQFFDKIIDFETGEEIDASNKFFSTNTIPFKLGKNEETPIIDKLFSEWVGETNKQTLYEIMAFTLIRDYFIHRIICLTGDGSNGKTKFIELIEKFIGPENTTSTDLDLLVSRPFEISKLYKKLLCTMGETNFNVLSRTSMLKRLTGQDLIGVEFKHKKPFDNRNYSKIIIATNSLPITEDRTEGFYRRWFILDFPNKFDENPNLLDAIPQKEYENLARKCISILKVLYANNGFSKEGGIAERKKAYEDHSNPILKFIEHNFEKDIYEKYPLFQFREDLEVYLVENRHRLLSEKEVSKALESMGYDIRLEHITREDGSDTKWRFVFGLKRKQSLSFLKDSGTHGTDGTLFHVSPLYKEQTQTSVPSVPSVPELKTVVYTAFKELQKEYDAVYPEMILESVLRQYTRFSKNEILKEIDKIGSEKWQETI